MRRRIYFALMVIVATVSSWSCEDSVTLPISNSFNGNKLQVFSIDTFTVATSLVQLDSSMTSGSGTILVGKYHDEELGTVSSSSYFQLSYASQFTPGTDFIYDSIAMILPYNHVYTGDTTQPVKLSLYQLTQDMVARSLSDNKYSVFESYGGSYSGFFNTSVVAKSSQPIVSTTVKFSPKSDSLYIKLPKSLGANWFRIAQTDSAQLFSIPSNFITYFKGLNLEVDPSTNACVVGFNASKVKIRIYYRQFSQYLSGIYTNAHTDFTIGAYNLQFNHIDYDRTGTVLASLQKLHPMSTANTNHTCYVQTGTGLVTRLDFPSLKNFFSLNQGIILNSAYLQISPITTSFPPHAPFFAPPSTLQLYTSDDSSLPLSYATGGSAPIQYDYEYPMNTAYQYQIFSFIYNELHANTNYFTPLIVGPSANQGTSVQRLYFGDTSYPENKIKLIIYYSYVPN